jgi:hypothetical protein
MRTTWVCPRVGVDPPSDVVEDDEVNVAGPWTTLSEWEMRHGPISR